MEVFLKFNYVLTAAVSKSCCALETGFHWLRLTFVYTRDVGIRWVAPASVVGIAVLHELKAWVGTLVQAALCARTPQTTQPNGPRAQRAKAVRDGVTVIVASVPAENNRVFVVPVAITHCPPHAAQRDLHATFIGLRNVTGDTIVNVWNKRIIASSTIQTWNLQSLAIHTEGRRSSHEKTNDTKKYKCSCSQLIFEMEKHMCLPLCQTRLVFKWQAVKNKKQIQCQGQGFDHDCPTFLLPVGLVFPLVTSGQWFDHDCPMILLPDGLF